MKIKAILDTNVLISGVFWKGPPFEILKAWQEQRFRLAISLPILDEYRRVLEEFAKERQMPVLNSVLKVIELRSEIVLSGHPKTGQWWSGQNRPTGRGRGLSCSTLQPPVEASLFSCANSGARI